MPSTLQRRRAITVVLLLAACACSTIEDMGSGASVIRMAVWVRAALIAVPATMMFGCLILARFQRVFGVFLGGGLLLVSVVLVPGIYMDNVSITRKSIVQTTGFWFSPTVKGFEYDDVTRVEIVKTVRNDRAYNAWRVTHEDGRKEDIDPGDLWDFNEAEIVSMLSVHGVVVHDAR